MTAGPLEGVRVLDLTRLLPGGYCTLLLADLGADVLKVEEPGRGDYIRWSPPLVEGISAAHRALNRGKRSITLNLKAPDGPDLLLRLAERADVLVESFRPGVMARLGVGFERLAERNPRLVYGAISGYGQDGPYRDVAGHDINYMGYGGGLWLGGPTGSEPRIPGVQVGDLGGASMAALGIVSALFERHRTGIGRFVDVSMLDGVVSWLSIHLGNHLADPAGSEGLRALSGDLACYRVYRAADGMYLTVGSLEPQFWRAFCQTLGCPEFAEEQYAPPERQAEMARAVQAILETRPRHEWLRTFQSVPACVGPVNDLAEAVADPQVRHRGMVAEAGGRPIGPGSPLKLGPAATGPAPGLGEHTQAVLEELGLTALDIGGLRSTGTI